MTSLPLRLTDQPDLLARTRAADEAAFTALVGAFSEAYDFVDTTTFRSRRYPDVRFTTAGAGSTVTLAAGEHISHWGEYSWRAASITANEACFEPIDAPSSFC